LNPRRTKALKRMRGSTDDRLRAGTWTSIERRGGLRVWLSESLAVPLRLQHADAHDELMAATAHPEARLLVVAVGRGARHGLAAR
jgi:hypothetical protein